MNKFYLKIEISAPKGLKNLINIHLFHSNLKGIFSVGYMLLSLIGYLLSDWQDQMIVILLAPLLYIPIYLYLPTSIAWLFSSRKFDQAR